MGSKIIGTAELTKAGFMGTTIDVVLYNGNGEVAGTGSQYVRAKDGDKVPINMPIFMNGTYPNGKWDGTYEITVR